MKYIDNLTFKLGLWLIGDRETPRESILKYSIDILEHDAWEDRTIEIMLERDAAIKERDDLKEQLICEGDRAEYSNNKALELMVANHKLTKKYLRLKRSYDKLKPKKPAKANTAKGKKK